jgi:predicted HicB family RNase H-like nuclease
MFEQVKRRESGHVELRRQREAKSISPTTARRARRAETKTAQINVRVTPSFKKRLGALAASRGVSIVELIETAIEQIGG